jgi:hypothetical protein
VPVGLDYWITPGRADDPGSSLHGLSVVYLLVRCLLGCLTVLPRVGCPSDQGIRRAWAASTARSAQSSLGLGFCRRSTATWWRSTSSAVSFDAGDRATRRYLASHVPQVAAELAEQFIGNTTGRGAVYFVRMTMASTRPPTAIALCSPVHNRCRRMRLRRGYLT